MAGRKSGYSRLKRKIRRWILLLVLSAGIYGTYLLEDGRRAFPPGEVYSSADIPAYNGSASVVLDNNEPAFTPEEKRTITGEHYSELDSLGRAQGAWALLERSKMPVEERGEIGSIRPSGWHTIKYPDLIDDMFLYNRCHLIAYALTGQNDNEQNLITGTRYFNTEGMLPYEIMTARYLRQTGHHVLYRVTPRFAGEELVARGVEMEAWSVEDEGAGLCFHVWVYNVQPGIEIDYLTGESVRSGTP